jgi:hypothetical protein
LNDQLNGFYKRYSISPQTINALVQPLMADSDLQLTQILNGVVQLAKLRPQLAQLITSLSSGLDVNLSAGESKLAAARRNIEEWFDDSMDRAGGWYKRNTQVWLGVVGFVLALMLNVDTLNITTALWRDPTLRQNVVEQAQKYQFSSSDGTSIATPDQAAEAIRDLNLKLSQELQVPMGWRTVLVSKLQTNQKCTWLPLQSGDIWGILRPDGCAEIVDAGSTQGSIPLAKLLGLIITAVAISQGATFWFDLLSKVANLRTSGAVPTTSQEKEKQKVSSKGQNEMVRAGS